MKKLIYCAGLLIILQACSESFIELTPISDQNTANFYRNQSDLEQAVIAAYDGLQSDTQYGINGFDHYMEVISDNSFNDNTTQAGGQRASFDNFNVVASNALLNDTWSSCYLTIQRCNIVLNRIEGVTMDQAIKTTRKGEVQFIRALTYFNMVRIWGDVPLVITETSDPFQGFEHVRSSTDDVYAQIVKDLQEAASLLPTKHQVPNIGRATKGAALTLLGKVYLTRKQYPLAVSTLEQVITSGAYQLLPNFADVFTAANKNNGESIFEVQYKSSTNGEGIATQPPTSTQDVNNRPSYNLLTFFKTYPDVRFEGTIALPNNAPAYSKKRFDLIGSDGTFGYNNMVLRYADVLLMTSEALNEIGYQNSGKAFEYLNQVRARAKAASYNSQSVPDQAAFRQIIERERRLELSMENHRWFDLVRTGKALEVMNAANVGGNAPNAGSALPFRMSAHQVLFPIPQTQIDASARKITQNSGY